MKLIKDTDLSTRVKNSLLNYAKIETVEQLKQLDDQTLLKIRGIGKKGLEEIIKLGNR